MTKHTYSNSENPFDLVIIKEDNSFSLIGDFDIEDEKLWDMADGLQVSGWTLS